MTREERNQTGDRRRGGEERNQTYDIVARETELAESRCEQEATISGLAPGVARRAVNDRCTVGVHQGRTLDEAYRSERAVVRIGKHRTLHFLFRGKEGGGERTNERTNEYINVYPEREGVKMIRLGKKPITHFG
jgi:hypothetical protein